MGFFVSWTTVEPVSSVVDVVDELEVDVLEVDVLEVDVLVVEPSLDDCCCVC